MSSAHAVTGPGIHGVAAQFSTSDALLEASKKAYGQGYRDMDAYSPIPVHGLPEAIGCKKTKVAAITFIGGILGAVGGFLMQYWMLGIAYPVNVGGRPLFSWPAFIPITFEAGVLVGGLTACLGMFAINNLPQPYHPIFNAPGFERASVDKFFLCVEATDEKFDKDEVRRFLEGLNPENVCEVPND